MQTDEVFHTGERSVQERAGERAKADVNGRVIEAAIPRAALGFIGQQAMAVLATVDSAGRPWSSFLLGEPGFLLPDTPQHVVADLSRAWLHPRDPFWRNVEERPLIGVLLIELATRRRLRINGRAAVEGHELHVQVDQAYPNCPKYIQRRHLRGVAGSPRMGVQEPRRDDRLSGHQQAWIAHADTLFVASLHPEHGADASHRGGSPGFVQVLGDRTLRIPDYSGNSMFNTLGNFAAYARAGVLVPDFAGGRTLQMVGEVEIRWDVDDPAGVTGGTGRFWDLQVQEVLEAAVAVQAMWEFLDPSPFNP